LALAGVFHFVVALIVWGFFYVACHRNGWQNSLTFAYGARHLSSAFALLGLFTWASIASMHRRRYATPLLAATVFLSVGIFAIEVRGDPQFERIWIDNPVTCTNHQKYFCTWWWWQPTRQ
jgi:hypothetical protein